MVIYKMLLRQIIVMNNSNVQVLYNPVDTASLLTLFCFLKGQISSERRAKSLQRA